MNGRCGDRSVVREASCVKRPNLERATLHEIRFTGLGRGTLHARHFRGSFRFHVFGQPEMSNAGAEPNG